MWGRLRSWLSPGLIFTSDEFLFFELVVNVTKSLGLGNNSQVSVLLLHKVQKESKN
jgi:hypothetical protein